MLDCLEINSSRLISLLSLNLTSHKISGHGTGRGGEDADKFFAAYSSQSAGFQWNVSEFSLHVPTFPCMLMTMKICYSSVGALHPTFPNLFLCFL